MEDFKETKYFSYLLSRTEILEKQFLEFNDKISMLMNNEIDELGTVLKSHLIIENFIDEYLIAAYPTITSWKGARLTFNQKLELINNSKTILALFYPAIKELNSLRNKFSHQLSYKIKENDLKEIKSQIAIWNKAAQKPIPEGLKLVEQFTLLISMNLNSMINSIKNESPELGISGYLSWIENMMKR